MRSLILIFILWVIETIQPVFAHVPQGHIIIAQRAMDQLSQPEKDYFNGMAKQLLFQLEPEFKKPTKKKYKQANAAALISRFPDDFKQDKLKDLFKKFGVQVPTALQPHQNKKTNHWHYMNKSLNTTCQHSPNNITKYIPLVIKAFKQSVALKDKAIMLAFIENLVADAHQPIHIFSQYNNRCISNYGGKSFCLRVSSSSGACEKDLHSLWDGSLGWLKNSRNVSEHISQLKRIKSNNKVSAPISTWIAENKQGARLAYATRHNSSPSKQYYIDGQLIMKQRYLDASDRLALILKGLYRVR